MSDLISRADAIARLDAVAQAAAEANLPDRRDGLRDAIAAIRALPAVEVGVRELNWVDFDDRGAKAQAWNAANYLIQKWSDGRYEISASYPGYSTSLEGIDRFYPTIEAAKAAAQADYAARIRSALTATPAQDVAGLVRRRAAQTLWDMLHMKNGAHEGMTRDEVKSLWDLVKEESGFSAVTTFLARMKEAGE